METLELQGLQQELRRELRVFQARNNGLAFAFFIADFVVALGLAVFSVLSEPIWLKALFSIGSGIVTSTLFVLGHDAAHGSLTSYRMANEILARLAFLPSLHNVTLWRIQHNRLHHQMPNVQGRNSWSPLSVDEYYALSVSHRILYRIYRSAFGMAPYYLIERWWKRKFFPRGEIDADHLAPAILDFLMLISWLTLWLLVLIWIGSASGQSNPVSAILWGFVIPFVVWNQFIGQTVLLQHTHPAVRWYRTADDASAGGGQETRTIHVRFPRWYGFLGHEIMEHPAHHINPMIPCYRLYAAQLRLGKILGTNAIVDRPTSLVSVIRRCKLYDYDRHIWVDFSGRQTSPIEIRKQV